MSTVTNISCVCIITASWKSTGDKRGICVAVFHHMVALLLLALLGVMMYRFWKLNLEHMKGKTLSIIRFIFKRVVSNEPDFKGQFPVQG